ncbi:MAG: hypothetical protein ACE5KT_08420 [Methanosarcinales archaeon]
MSGKSLVKSEYDYDYDMVKEAQLFAKKTHNDYLEALIEGFLFENDPKYRHTMYQAIIEGTAELKEIWGYDKKNIKN